MPEAVVTVVRAPDDGCQHLKHVELHKEIQGDSKRWTQLYSKWRLNTCQTVGCGIPSSLLALRVDLHGLRSKLS